MRFLKLTIAYEGTAYVGWQVQPNGLSVQQVLESAWHSVTGETRRITASGRTDSGVHARGQVCSLETASRLPGPRLVAALNAWLPEDIRVLRCAAAPLNFHAIRDAISKTYRYCIQDGRQADLFQRRYCWHIPRRLDIAAMRQAAAGLTGTRDFSSFEAAGAERLDTIRTITRLEITDRPQPPFRQIEIEITADGFLYNMVRNIVGTLVVVGRGQQPPEWVSTVLQARSENRPALLHRRTACF